MLPEGFILAAEVDVVYDVKDIHPLAPQYFKTIRSLINYDRAGGRLSDLHPEQVINARIDNDSSMPREPIFTDIEPMTK